MDVDKATKHKFTDKMLENKRSISEEGMIKDEFCEDPPLDDFDDKEMFGDIFIKEGIKEEYLEDDIPLPDQAIESLYAQEENFANDTSEPVVPSCIQEKEMLGDILMKEEIKEEDLEDEILISDQAAERLDFQEENSANSTSKQVLPNCLQEKIVCPLSNVMDGTSSPLHSNLFICTTGLKLQKKPTIVSQPFKRNYTHQTTLSENPNHQKITENDILSMKCSSSSSESVKNSDLFKYSGCHNQATQSSKPLEHERINTNEKPFKCSVGSFIAANKSNHSLHERMHSFEKPFKCSLCPYQSAQKSHLSEHERKHTGEKPYKCSVCPYEAAHRSNLRRHLKAHTGEKPFKCSFCSYEAAYKTNLRKHERMHTGEKPFKCSSCPYKSAQKTHLNEHERSHTGEKPFKCSVCPYGAIKKSDLRRHERTHSDEKPFKCNSCPYRTTDSSTLRRHKRIHTGEKPFKCSSCPYESADCSTLRRHEKTHMDDKPFKHGPRKKNVTRKT